MKSTVKILLGTILSLALLFSSICPAYAMTYHSNVVELTSETGISILNGSFTVTALNITSGQDPKGRNYVGKTYSLQNGELTFSVGRSGSTSVANWFNQQYSCYNDIAVNGDRTTFDHTANKLNFALVGNLTMVVTTADYPQGISVTFPGVAFAQGSTGSSNNWWFGQLTGQHTRDSDGPNTMLVFGTTTTGEVVYARFLRGGNSVNEVTLEAIKTVSAARSSVTKLANVESTFANLPITGTKVNLLGFPGSYDPTTNHIQGYAQYDSTTNGRYSILTHSVATASYAHIVAGPKNTGDKWGFKTYLEDWNHPGGIQVIGDYLLVPSEQTSSAHIALYDLRALAVGELRRVETFDLAVNHKAGALSITTYTDQNSIEYYLLVVAHLDGENSVYHIYRAPTAGGIENASFIEVGSFNFEKDFQGFGLVTELGTGAVYMIGLWSQSEGATFADYAYLYQLNTQTWTIGSEIDQIHMASVGGGAGVMGVHFRYGANVCVLEDGSLMLSATERNFVLGSALATNDWVA